MRKLRWLPASLLALLLSVQAAWSQGVPITLQGLNLLPGPYTTEADVYSVGSRVSPSRTQECQKEEHTRRAVNQARVHVAVSEEEQEVRPSAPADCRTSCPLTQIMNKLGLGSGSSCSANSPCCEERTACPTQFFCMPTACNALFAYWKPMMGCSGKVSVGSCCTEGKVVGVTKSCCSGQEACCQEQGVCAKPGVEVVNNAPCCKAPGRNGCCPHCACKGLKQTSVMRGGVVFPHLGMFQQEIHLLPPSPMIISGFTPLPQGVMAPTWVAPVIRGGMVPPQWAGQYKLASRSEEPGQSVYQVNATGNLVHISTPQLQAQCQRMTCLGTRDRVLLEGNVRLTCKKDGQVTRIEAPRVLVDLLHGTFTVESGQGSLPVPMGPVGVNTCPSEQGSCRGATVATPCSQTTLLEYLIENLR